MSYLVVAPEDICMTIRFQCDLLGKRLVVELGNVFRFCVEIRYRVSHLSG